MKTSFLLIILCIAIGCTDELIIPIENNPLIEYTEDSKSISIDVNSTSESILMIQSCKISVDTTIISKGFYSCYSIKKEKWSRVFTFIDKDREYSFIPGLKK